MTVREVILAARLRAAQVILTAADDRDVRADLRDAATDKRENDLDRIRLLAAPNRYGYGNVWPERRAAALDRMRSKDDRTASRDDRIHLTGGYGEDEPDQT